MVEGREEAASGRQGLSGQTWGWALRCLCPWECLLCSPLFLSTDTPPPHCSPLQSRPYACLGQAPSELRGARPWSSRSRWLRMFRNLQQHCCQLCCFTTSPSAWSL